MNETFEDRLVAVLRVRLNEKRLAAELRKLEARIDEQESELPWEFCDDESLWLYVVEPHRLRDELREVLEAFVQRYQAVDARRKLFFRRWQIEQALEGALVLILDGEPAEA